MHEVLCLAWHDYVIQTSAAVPVAYSMQTTTTFFSTREPLAGVRLTPGHGARCTCEQTEESRTADKQHSLAICLTTHNFRAPAENHGIQSCGFRARSVQQCKACLVLNPLTLTPLGSAPCDLNAPNTPQCLPQTRADWRAGRRLRHWTRNRKCEFASPWKRPRKRNLLPGKGRTTGKLHYDLASQSSLRNRKWSRDGRNVPLDGVLPGLGPQRPGAFGAISSTFTPVA